MADENPAWLKLVLRAERVVGTRVESAVHSGTYFDLLAQWKHSRARVTHVVEGVSKRVIHLANLPAGTDVRHIREQLSRIERRLVDVSKEVDDLGAHMATLPAAGPADEAPA